MGQIIAVLYTILTTPVDVMIDISAIDSSTENNRLAMTYTLTSTVDTDVNVFFGVVDEDWRDRPIIINYDPNYFPMFTTWRAIYGVYDHVIAQSEIEHYTGEISQATSREIRTIMESLDTEPIIVLSSGLFPEEISPDGDHTVVRTWLEAGGILVWVGDGLSYHISSRQITIPGDVVIPPTTRGWESSIDLIGYNPIDSIQRYGMNLYQSAATEDTLLSDALGLTYDNALRGALTDVVQEHGGQVLGKLYNVAEVGPDRTAIASLPVGDGIIVLFGDALRDNEKVVSTNIVRVLTSSILFDRSEQPHVRKYTLKANEPMTDEIIIDWYGEIPENISYYIRQDDSNSISSWVGLVPVDSTKDG